MDGTGTKLKNYKTMSHALYHANSSFETLYLYVYLGVHVEIRKLERGHDGVMILNFPLIPFLPPTNCVPLYPSLMIIIVHRKQETQCLNVSQHPVTGKLLRDSDLCCLPKNEQV